MSVINKMLRDLDRRTQEQGGASTLSLAPAAVMRGTSSVGVLPPGDGDGRHRMRESMAVVVVACILVGGVVWWTKRPLDAAQQPVQASSPPLGALARPAADESPAGQATPPSAMSAAPGPRTSSNDSQQGAATPFNTLTATPAPTPPVSPDKRTSAEAQHMLPGANAAEDRPLVLRDIPGEVHRPAAANLNAPAPKASAVLASASAVVLQAPLAPAPPGPATATAQPMAASAQMPPPSPRWQDAAIETVAQAQQLWAGGARDPALELLRQALPAMERAHGPELATTGAAATLAMLRELARMELAQGQAGAVLALLQRHDYLLPGRADLWAMRANAAQRMGQHAEASQAYQTALKIRPGEPRWMLGAAVSLAALGQLAGAAEMAEQARGMQEVNPEILAYLRQLGVQLRDR